jgi:hypothetical protein
MRLVVESEERYRGSELQPCLSKHFPALRSMGVVLQTEFEAILFQPASDIAKGRRAGSYERGKVEWTCTRI